MQRYFESEVNRRLVAIEALPPAKDSLKIRARKVDERVEELILISRDVENLSACVNLSNAFFGDLAKEFAINPTDFNSINKGMHVNEVAVVLRQNELNFLNQLLFKSGAKPMLYTAQ